MVTPTEATQDPDCPDYVELEDGEPIDDWPSQEALENHMTLAYLEHCFNLEPSTHDD